MSVLSIQPTFPIFTDIDGQPLENGYIFIGQANQNPITNPISVFFNIGLTVLAAQPIRTIGGYPANAGTPGRLYVNSDYSIQVQNKNGSVVYSSPTATEQYSSVVVNNIDFSSLTASTALALDASKNIISVTNTGTGNNVLATSPALNGPRTDTILELTAAAGVTVDGVLLKDTTVTANTVKASGTASSQGKVEFFEDTDNGTNFVALQAAAAIAADVTFTLPAADGTSGQVIQTDGSGALSFVTPASPTIASTAEAQAGTDNTVFITPLRMREGFNASGSAPVFATRAWVNFNGTTTPPAIRASGNVSTVTDLGPGQYLVNFTTNMSDVNFSAVATCNETDNGTVCQARLAAVSNIAIDIYDSPAGLTNRRADPTNVNVAIFR